MRTNDSLRAATLAGIGLAALCMLALPARAARERKGAFDDTTTAGGVAAMEARRRCEAALELMKAKETDRAVRMYESILEQYPNTPSVYRASLELGRHYLEAREQTKALPLFARLKVLEDPDKELKGDEKEWFLESQYLTGVAYFQTRQFAEAFPVLRKITNKYSGTVWANQSYYYIGMCHFAQRNWSKAIESLGLVGAFADPDSPTAEYMEAGRRFYARVEDRDLPLLARLGKQPRVVAKTAFGDAERIETIPLTADGTVIGSIATAIGVAKPGDGTLQVLSGDTITSTYTDEGTEAGVPNVARTNVVKVVATGSVAFMLGDYQSAAVAAYLNDSCFLVLLDADLDVSGEADVAEVTVISRYKKEVEGDTENLLERRLEKEKELEYVTRDQVRVPVQEQGTNTPIRTGRFTGDFRVEEQIGKDAPSQNDDILTCEQGDEIVATYTDALNIDGPVTRTATASLPVLGRVDSRPRTSQDFVSDPVVLAKKNVVEGTAYLELARIFRSMGLLKGAKEKVASGLDRSVDVIRLTEEIPVDLRQEAFKVTWELYMAADDFANAMTVCSTFNKLYPDSPLVDEAMMGMGRVHLENKQYKAAISMFEHVLSLQQSEAKGEAQYRIGEATELAAEETYQNAVKAGQKVEGDPAARCASAIPAYKMCAERYPESVFAPRAIEKVVDYYVATKDFPQAGTLLEQVFTDYPDAPFLDSMLLKWTLVAYSSGDYAKARDKCQQLVSEYPESPYAEKAKGILPKILTKLQSAADSGGGDGSGE